MLVRSLVYALALLLFTACGSNLPRELTRRAESGDTHYSAPVGGVVGSQEERFFNEFLRRRDEIRSIEVAVSQQRNFRVIQCIRIRVDRRRGEDEIITIGNPAGADFQREFRPRGRAELVGISGRSGWYIDAIRFHFSDGDVTPMYGGEGGDTSFDLRLAEAYNGRYKGRVIGLYGTAGSFVESLGLIFEAE